MSHGYGEFIGSATGYLSSYLYSKGTEHEQIPVAAEHDKKSELIEI